MEIKDTIKLNEIEEEYEFKTEIKDSKTKIDVNVSNTKWSNKQQNEVTFDINLEAKTIKENMLRNPYIEIELPSEVEKVILGTSNIFYANNLELTEPSININGKGNKVITVSLVGIQDQYYDNELDLVTNVKIPATIILQKDMEQDINEETINVVYANQYTINNSYEIGTQKIELQLENYKEEPEQQELQILREPQNESNKISQELSTQISDKLEVEVTPTISATTLKDNDIIYEGEYIKYNIKITNTTSEDIQNVKIVADIPDGVTYGELETDYYSYRSEYQYNFNEELTEKVINIDLLKAEKSVDMFYEVKVDDLKEESKQITTKINTYIDEALAKTYEIKNTINKAKEQAFLSTLIDFSDSWAYGLNLKSTEEKEVTVKMHFPKEFKMNQIQYVRHIVSNPAEFEGTSTDNAITIYTNYDPLPLDMEEQIRDIDIQITEDNTVIAKLKTNQFYEFIGNIDRASLERTQNGNIAELISYAEIVDDSSTYYSNENRIQIAYQNVSVSMTSPNEGEKVKYGEEIDYNIEIENIGETNVTADGVKYVNINILDFLPENIEAAQVTYDTWTAETRKKEDKSTYLELIKQENIEKNLPDEIYDSNGNKLPNLDIDILLPKDEKVTIKVKALAGAVSKETKIENMATIKGEEIESKTTNKITHIILPPDYEETEDPTDPTDPSTDPTDTPTDPSTDPTDTPTNPTDPSTDPTDTPTNPDNPEENYSLSGTAWIDENEDGRRDSDERTLSGITTILVDMNDPTKDKETVKTNNRGQYKFNNIEKGNYVILFQYDTEQYRLTQYHEIGVNDQINSDVINKTVILDGNKTIVGITDTIKLKEDTSNIDIGLIENKLCDFKVDKYISKVTVKTAKGTTQYNFNNQSLPKLEIKGNEVEGANVTIEYKIIVTNVGETSGTVGKIVDYLPNELNLVENSNKNWVKNKNGEVVNEAFSNTKIDVGDSVECNLIVTKKMTSNNTGTIKNTVKIQNVKNTANTVDKNEKNNNAEIELIISIKTGVITYTLIIIAVVLVLIIIAIIIYKNKSNMKKINKSIFISIFFAIILFTQVNGVKAAFWRQQYWFDYDQDHKYLHQFFGGPTGIAKCMNHSAQAYDGWFNYSSERCTRTGSTTTTVTGDFTLEKQDSTVKVKASGDNYIFGPFSFNCSENATYECVVKSNDSDETTIRNAVVCRAGGDAKTLSGHGDKTFYVKIPKSSCSNGVAKVIMNATRQVTTKKVTKKYYKAKYSIDIPDSQPVESTEITEGDGTTETTEEKDEVTKKITWTSLPVTMDIYKLKDSSIDPNSRQLSNTSFVLKNDGGSYIQAKNSDGEIIANITGIKNIDSIAETSNINEATVLTTDADGYVGICNLPIDKYNVIETSCPHYGYTSMVSTGLKKISTGKYKIEKLPNSWQVGNLEIHKVDKATKKPLPSVSFKIKNSSGQYVVAHDNNGVEQRSVTGTITLSNMTFDSTGTTFITDANGNIRINYMLAGTYSIIETGISAFGYSVKSTPDVVTVNKANSATDVVSKTIENEKDTGNLVINKVDTDSNRAMAGVSFKVKAPNGQYIIAHNRYTTYTSKQCNRRYFNNRFNLYNRHKPSNYIYNKCKWTSRNF